MNSKPLSRSQLEWIARLMNGYQSVTAIDVSRIVSDLLAAEQFWREAVKNADVCDIIGDLCPWCGSVSWDCNVEAVHKPDCPWVLAQEEK